MSAIYSCSCCGGGDLYETEDATCEPCKEWIEERFTKPAEDKALELLRGALNETNRAKFDSFDRELQLGLVGRAIEEGILTWKITRS